MKAARRALVGAPCPPLPPAFPVVGVDARARFRLHSLMQDYEQLLKETAAKRRRLQMARQRVLNLTDEVKFLRRRYKYLTKNSSPSPYNMKILPQKAPITTEHKAKKTPAACDTQHKSGVCVLYGQHSQHDSSCRDKEVVVPRHSPVLDLNKIFLPDGEEEVHVAWDPLPTEKPSKRHLLHGNVSGSESKLSACRDVGGGNNRTEKRKFSWQDQAALKV